MRLLMAILAVGLCTSGVSLGADGVELYKQGRFSDAERALRESVGAKEDDAIAHRYLGLVLLEERKYPEALDHLNRAAEIEPGREATAAMARYHAETMEFDRAQEALKDFDGESKASSANADYARGLIQLDKKQYAAAAQNIESFIRENPNSGYAHYYAGLAYNGAGRKDKMLSEFQLFLKIHPNAPEARKVRAVLQTGR